MNTKIRLNDVEIEVVRKVIKNIYLRVCLTDGRIKISAPLQMSIRKIKKFVLTKLDWIKKTQKKIRKKVRLNNYEYVNNEIHYYRGKKYPLKIIFNNKYSFANFNDEKIFLNVPPKSTVEERKLVMNLWYRKQLMLLIPPLINKWEGKLKVSVENFFVRSMKTRWGSCTPKTRRIRFNLELAKASPQSLEYIVVHELLHLLEASHNKRFKALMDLYYPGWKLVKEELKKINTSS